MQKTILQRIQNIELSYGLQSQGGCTPEIMHMQNQLYYKQSLSAIAISESEEKAKIRSDVASQKELQQTKISINGDGTVILNKEQFGSDIQGKLGVKIHRATRLKTLEDKHEPAVLVVQIEEGDGRINDLFFRSDQLEDRFIRRQFDKVGISFGFGIKKEMEVKKKLVLSIMREAESMEIPEKHGWYQDNGVWHYAFPEVTTWREVQACI